MQKWLITYLFIVGSICLHIAGFANPVKTTRTTAAIKSSYTATPRAFAFNKPSQNLTDYPLHHHSGNIVFHYSSLRVSYPVQSNFTAEPNFFFTISNHYPGEAISNKEVERELKDHLLHLFPSHYFW